MKINIGKWKIGAILIFFLYALPSSLYRFQICITLQDIVAYLCFAYFICDILIGNIKNHGVIFWMIFIMWFLVGISTSMQNFHLLLSFGKLAVKSIAFLAFIERGLKKHGIEFLRVIWFVLCAIAFINLCSIIIYPEGMYTSGVYNTNYFMGYHNSHIRWELPALMVKYAYDKVIYGKIQLSSLVISCFMFVSAVLVSSITSIIIFILLDVFIIYEFMSEKLKTKYRVEFSPLIAFITLVIGTSFVVGGTIAATQLEVIANVSQYFGKGTSLHGRSYIWISTLSYIAQHLWIGNGYETSDMTSVKLVEAMGWGNSSHNLLFEVLYIGGFLLLICMTIIYIYLQWNYKKYFYQNKTIVIVGIWLMLVSIMGIVEPQYEEYTRFMWLLAYYIPIIESQYRNSEKRS